MNRETKKIYNMLMPASQDAAKILNRVLTTSNTITKPEVKFIRTLIGNIPKEEYDRLQYVILSTMTKEEKFK